MRGGQGWMENPGMTIRTMRAAWFGLLIAASAAVAAADGVALTDAELAQQAKSAQEPFCRTPPSIPQATSDAERRALVQAQAAQCACMTRSLDSWVQSAPVVSRWQAFDAVRQITETCTARHVRELVAAFCDAGLDPLARPKDPPVTEPRRRARCECLNQGLAPLTDAQLVESASVSYKDFRAKVQARMASAPDPAPTPSPVNTVEQTCRAPGLAR